MNAVARDGARFAMTPTRDTIDPVREAPERPSERRIGSLPPRTFELLLQVTLDQHLLTSDPDLRREAELAQRAARETAHLHASDPDLQLEAELAQPRLYDEDLEVELDLYYAFDADLEVDMIVIHGDTDEVLDDPWFDSYDADAPWPDDPDAWN